MPAPPTTRTAARGRHALRGGVDAPRAADSLQVLDVTVEYLDHAIAAGNPAMLIADSPPLTRAVRAVLSATTTHLAGADAGCPMLRPRVELAEAVLDHAVYLLGPDAVPWDGQGGRAP